jgi:hypothetical protein
MNWYKIRVNDGTERGYTYVGSSPDSLETLLEKASRREYIRLDDLLYMDDRGDIKDWAKWSNREAPTICINPANVVAIQPFKDDPRTLSR